MRVLRKWLHHEDLKAFSQLRPHTRKSRKVRCHRDHLVVRSLARHRVCRPIQCLRLVLRKNPSLLVCLRVEARRQSRNQHLVHHVCGSLSTMRLSDTHHRADQGDHAELCAIEWELRKLGAWWVIALRRDSANFWEVKKLSVGSGWAVAQQLGHFRRLRE